MTDDRFGWRHSPPIAKVMSALNRHGEARFVGGCVRDSLLGHQMLEAKSTDIDMATTLVPAQVKAALAEDGIKMVPTGEAHGTITAIVDKMPIEVTTLRSDVSTDGRHATVAFTDSWEEDAKRRDFTINALYLDQHGDLFDPTGGVADLERSRVRFIGQAADRIREDYLRILRFLRFSARFSGTLDPSGWAACTDLRAGMAQLAKERIWQELSKLLNAQYSPAILHPAARDGLLQEIIDGPADVDAFAHVHREMLNDDGGSSLSLSLGLAALWPQVPRDTFAAALKPPKAILNAIDGVRSAAKARSERRRLRDMLYHFGVDAVADAEIYMGGRRQDRRRIREEVMPLFRVQGRHLLARGVSAGPALGATLRRIEEAWIAENLPNDPDRFGAIVDRVLSEDL